VSYEWAIISGGAPSVPTGKGCRTGQPGPLEEQYFGGKGKKGDAVPTE